MLFSIIVPVYNVELYLRDCLDSIFCQDFYSCEIICVNDGSTDNSRHILEEYKDRITIVDQSNLGLSAARNTGLKHSKGDYVWFVDSDDMIAKDSFVKLEKIIADTRAEIIFFSAENFIDTNIVKKWGEYNRKFTGIYKAIDYFELQCDSNNYFVSACMYIFKKEKYKELEFKEGILHEDNLFTTQLIFKDRNATIFSSLEKLFIRRIRDDSIMTTKISEKNFFSYDIVVKELINFHNEKLYIFLFQLVLSNIINAYEIKGSIIFDIEYRKIFLIYFNLFKKKIKTKYLFILLIPESYILYRLVKRNLPKSK